MRCARAPSRMLFAQSAHRRDLQNISRQASSIHSRCLFRNCNHPCNRGIQAKARNTMEYSRARARVDRSRIYRSGWIYEIRRSTPLAAYLEKYTSANFQESEFDPRLVGAHDHPECRADSRKAGWRGLSEVLLRTIGQLHRLTFARLLLGVAQTSRVERKGVLPQAVYLNYSQARLASYGLQPADLSRVLLANITLPGGSIQAGTREIRIDPSGQFEDGAFDRKCRRGDVACGRADIPARYRTDRAVLTKALPVI